MSDSELAYSTSGFSKPKPEKKSKTLPAKGPAKVRLEKKGRKGKVATIVYDLPLTEPAAKAFKQELQASFACGASLKDGLIILNGDFVKQVKEVLKKRQNT